MMSQNRQGEKDRAVNSFVSTIILRTENQTRHVNAKMDHLLTHQWKRLLEIQEIQIDLLQILQQQQKGSLSSSDRPARFRSTEFDKDEELHEEEWKFELFPYEHAKMVLREMFQIAKAQDEFIFAHWHTDGDNFTGYIENVTLSFKNDLNLKWLEYDIVFTDEKATMDDIFSGEGTITMRNDFDLAHMDMLGTHFPRINDTVRSY